MISARGRAGLSASAALFCAGCRAQPAHPPSTASASSGWSYEVGVGPSAGELAVEGSFPRGTEPKLVVDDDAAPFVRDMEIAASGSWQAVREEGGAWMVPSCRSEGCRIRYRFRLAEAAGTLDDTDAAFADRGALVAPPSTWLVRPISGPSAESFFFHVTHPPGVAFATGVFPWQGRPDTFGAGIDFLGASPYTAFGAWRLSRLPVSGGVLELGFGPGAFVAGEAAILAWITSAAAVVSRYYRRFPVTRALLLVIPTRRAGFGYAKTLGNGGASIVAPIGEKTTRAELDRDWVLVHEMFHLGFPNLPRAQIWLSEGLATYLEPLARARAGRLSPEEVWRGMVEGLPHGLPEPGDEGLDRTHTWGRTYWGGALFCLLADLEIRKRTDNRRSLDDAMRAILDDGGNAATEWELARVLGRGDAATGVPVLSELHRKMGAAAFSVDLAQLFRDLGVKAGASSVTFDDTAPLAPIRRAITSHEP